MGEILFNDGQMKSIKSILAYSNNQWTEVKDILVYSDGKWVSFYNNWEFIYILDTWNYIRKVTADAEAKEVWSVKLDTRSKIFEDTNFIMVKKDRVFSIERKYDRSTGEQDWFLTTLDTATGAVMTESTYILSSEALSNLTIDDNLDIYFGSTDRTIYKFAYDSAYKNYRRIYNKSISYSGGWAGTSDITLDSDSLYATMIGGGSQPDQAVIKLNKATGSTVWKTTKDIDTSLNFVRVIGNKIIAYKGYNSTSIKITSYIPTTGALIETKTITAPIGMTFDSIMDVHTDGSFYLYGDGYKKLLYYDKDYNLVVVKTDFKVVTRNNNLDSKGNMIYKEPINSGDNNSKYMWKKATTGGTITDIKVPEPTYNNYSKSFYITVGEKG